MENTPKVLKNLSPTIMLSGSYFMIGWTACQFILQKLWLVKGRHLEVVFIVIKFH